MFCRDLHIHHRLLSVASELANIRPMRVRGRTARAASLLRRSGGYAPSGLQGMESSTEGVESLLAFGRLRKAKKFTEFTVQAYLAKCNLFNGAAFA